MFIHALTKAWRADFVIIIIMTAAATPIKLVIMIIIIFFGRKKGRHAKEGKGRVSAYSDYISAMQI